MNKIIKFIEIIFASIFIALGSDTSSNTLDTSRHNNYEQIVPLTFLSTGIILAVTPAKYKLQEMMPNTDTKAEDFIQYAPMVELYTANIFLRKHQSSVWDQSKYLIISQLSNALLVRGLKYATQEKRPDGSNYHSFPSGHTSQAFVGATVLYHEYIKSAPILAYSGYAFALTTAILRVTNDKHWVPDVLAGAGIGMLVTNLVYYIKPLRKWQPFKKKKKTTLTLTPQFNVASTSYWMAGVLVGF